jgi:hypothetical protein
LVIVSLVVLTLATIYFVFQTSYFQKIIISKLTSNISESIDAEVSIGSVDIALFRKLVLNDVYISDQQKDTLLYAQKLVAGIDSLSFTNRNIHFKSISLINPKINVRKDSVKGYNFDFLFENDTLIKVKSEWNFHSSRIELKNGEFIYSDSKLKDELKKLLQIHKIDLILDDVKLTEVNNFSFNIKRLQLVSSNGFELNGFSTTVQYKDSIFSLKHFNGSTAYSQLKIDSLSFDFKKYFESKNAYDIKVDLQLKKLNIDFHDFAILFPEYASEGLNIGMSGRLYGKISEIKGKGVKANLGEITRINSDFYLNGLPDIENTYIFINLFESYANLTELRKLNLPEKLQFIKSSLPNFLDNVGAFSYRGNFTGFKNDFVAYGTAYSNLGSIESDVSFKPSGNKVLKVSGHIKTQNLNVGSILKTKQIEKLTLNGELDGSIADTAYNLTFNGVVDTIYINKYRFQKIGIIGNLKNKIFDGSLVINDPYLKMTYFGSLDLSPALPVFKFIANVNYADLYRLNLSKDKVSKIKFSIDANFEGNNIDNLVGSVKIDSLSYRSTYDVFSLKRAIINNTSSDGKSTLSLKSDWIDAEIRGKYSFKNISNSLINFYQHYLPSSILSPQSVEKDENNFIFSFFVKSPDPITRVFLPDLFLQPPFEIKGFYNATDQTGQLETFLPYFRYSSREVDSLTLKIDATHETLTGQMKSRKIHLAKNLNLHNLVVDAIGKDDQMGVNILWNNNEMNNYSGTIRSMTTFTKSETKFPHVVINIEPSKVYFSDSLWNLDESTVQIDSSSVVFGGTTFHRNEQQIFISGKVSENEESTASATINNIEFSLINPLLGETGITGSLNGKIEVANIYKTPKLNLNLLFSNFTYQDALLGDLQIKSNWKSDNAKLESQITLKNKDQILIDGFGYIDPKNNAANLNLVLDQTPISLLEIIVPSLFYDSSGKVTGKVNVSGPLSKLDFNGKLTPATKVGLGIKSIKAHYFFSDPVYFKNDSLIFTSIKIEDEFGNIGKLRGSIVHQNFNNLKYNLTITSNKILAMNTTISDNDKFYGIIFASGNFSITGKGSEILLKGDVRSEKGTNIFIPFEGKEEASKYDFIQFVNTKTPVNQPTEPYNPISNGLSMNFDVEITPDAKAQIIFNSQMGDIIKGEGNGNLQVKVDKNFNINLYGDCVIEKGEYLFTLENIINKKFVINRGGTIKWTGDPYNAQVDLTAVYKVKTTISELFPETKSVDPYRRWPVDCIIKLNESLLQPVIDFKIELPTADDQKKDALARLIVTKEDVNRQMISLLMLGSFYTPDFFTGKTTTETGTQLMGTTASELISNQLSNWLSQINNVWNIGVNYRPKNEISNDQVELAISTQILDDRIIIDGNVANNSNPASKNSGEIVGDFDVKVKLTNDGRLQFKAFNHSNDNSNYDIAPYTQGIGFSYREEFNTLKELLQQYKKAVFKKKKNKTEKEAAKNQAK